MITRQMIINQIDADTVIVLAMLFVMGILSITKNEAISKHLVENEVLKPKRTQKQQEKLEKELKIIARVGGCFFCIVSTVYLLLVLFYPWPEI